MSERSRSSSDHHELVANLNEDAEEDTGALLHELAMRERPDTTDWPRPGD